jgi:hypothetical protein
MGGKLSKKRLNSGVFSADKQFMRRLVINLVLFCVILEALAQVDWKVLIAGTGVALAVVLCTGLILDGGQIS